MKILSIVVRFWPYTILATMLNVLNDWPRNLSEIFSVAFHSSHLSNESETVFDSLRFYCVMKKCPKLNTEAYLDFIFVNASHRKLCKQTNKQTREKERARERVEISVYHEIQAVFLFFFSLFYFCVHSCRCFVFIDGYKIAALLHKDRWSVKTSSGNISAVLTATNESHRRWYW